MAGVIGFIGFAGFVGYYLILSRVLRELDPAQAIPDRVKAAFDTLAEGVLILDERGYILLANDAFLKNVYNRPDSLIGLMPGIYPGYWRM
jgi:PAS domain-containing protein